MIRGEHLPAGLGSWKFTHWIWLVTDDVVGRYKSFTNSHAFGFCAYLATIARILNGIALCQVLRQASYIAVGYLDSEPQAWKLYLYNINVKYLSMILIVRAVWLISIPKMLEDEIFCFGPPIFAALHGSSNL